MQTPAPFFVDETATFHIAVCRLLYSFFQIVAPKTRLYTQSNTPSTFTFLLKFLYFSRQHSAAFFDTTTFHVYADSNQILPFRHRPTQSPSPISLSTPSLHFRALDKLVLLLLYLTGFRGREGVFIRLDTTGGIVVSVAVYISYLSLEHRVFFLALDLCGLYSIAGFGFLSHAIPGMCRASEINEVVDVACTRKVDRLSKEISKIHI